jgi:hypothetical protein
MGPKKLNLKILLIFNPLLNLNPNMMKNFALIIALSAGFLFSCNKEDDNPNPNKQPQAATLTGKWDNKTEERKEYNASGGLVKTENKVYEPGTHLEFVSDGTFRQYFASNVTDTGTYTHTGNKVVIKVNQFTLPAMYVQSLTASELVLRDTVPGNNGGYAVRINRATR